LRTSLASISKIYRQKQLQNLLTIKLYSIGLRRIDINCGVSYGDDLEKVEKTAITAMDQMDNRIKDKPVTLIYNQFANSSINFILRIWIKSNTQLDFLEEQSKAIKILKSAFDKEDIMIPFPITTLDFGIRGGTPLNRAVKLPTNKNRTKSVSKN